MVAVTAFERAVEMASGESVASLRDMPIDERRKIVEEKCKRRMSFPSFFPFIGRGSVLRDCTISREEIEAQLDELLK